MKINKLINIRSFLLLLMLPPNAYAIRDATFIHRHESQLINKMRMPMHRVSCTTDSCMPMPYPRNQAAIESDQYNYYLYSDHFRVVYAVGCAPNGTVRSYGKRMLEIAEEVYQKQVIELSLNPPEGNDEFYTDIFLGKKSRTEDCRGKDYVSGGTVEWYDSYIDSYAGFASEHPVDDGVAYLVMNAGLTDQLLQATLAHEIHHTIQFSYKHFENSYFSDSYLDEDLWILEAMATMMESVVYPEIDDYVYYVNRWYAGMNKSLDTLDGVHEYGAAVLPLYLQSVYGVGIINTILEYFSGQNGWQSILKLVLLEQEGVSLSEAFRGFIAAIWEPESHFVHGDQFNYSEIESLLVELDPEQDLRINKFGIQPVLFSEDTSITFSEHLYEWTPPSRQACEEWGESENRILCRQQQEVVLFADRDLEEVSTPSIMLDLQEGWNLVGITAEDPRLIKELFGTAPDIIWAERSSPTEWTVGNLAESEDTVGSLNSGWLYSDENRGIRLLGENLENGFGEQSLGWNLMTLPDGQLTGESGLDSFREQIAQQSGYTLSRFLFYTDGEWKSWNYERRLGGLSGIDQATAIWGYLK